MNPRFRRSRGAEEEESYFISMADMMVGLGPIDIQRIHIMAAARHTKPLKWMVRRS